MWSESDHHRNVLNICYFILFTHAYLATGQRGGLGRQSGVQSGRAGNLAGNSGKRFRKAIWETMLTGDSSSGRQFLGDTPKYSLVSVAPVFDTARVISLDQQDR